MSCLTMYSRKGVEIVAGVITVLSIVVQNANIQSRLGPVYYLKALDIYVMACLALVFFTWLEFIMSHYYYYTNPSTKKSATNHTTETDEEVGAIVETNDTTVRKSLLHGIWRIRRKITAKKIDKSARVLLPLVFLAFNIVYFITLSMSRQNKQTSHDDHD